MIADIKGFEGLYGITNDGRVFSYPKKTISTNGRWLKLSFDGRYKQVCLFKNGKKHMMLVHRLVAQAYCNNDCDKPHVNHIDGNKENNHASNLEWVTESENMQHAVNNGLLRVSEKQKDAARKIGLKSRKFTDDQIRKIRKLAEMTFRHADIAEWFGVDRSAIGYIVNRKTYAEVI